MVSVKHQPLIYKTEKSVCDTFNIFPQDKQSSVQFNSLNSHLVNSLLENNKK